MNNTTEFRFDDAEMNNSVNFEDKETSTLEPVTLKEPETPEKIEKLEKTGEIEVDEEGLSKADKALYLDIYDSMMFTDQYKKVVKLGKKYSVVFVTRNADADVKISRELDAMDFQTMSAYQTMAAVLTMSYSLHEFNGKDLSTMNMNDRYKFIRNKSSHVIEMLSKHMVDFDQLIRKALMYGEVNF